MLNKEILDVKFSTDERCDSEIKKYLVEIVAVICENFGDNLKALILSGAMPTGEASAFISADGEFHLLSDFDFYAVSFAPINNSQKEKIISKIKLQFSDKDKPISDIGLAVITEDYFARLEKTVSTYSLRNNGLVVFGECNLKDLIKDFPASEISKYDAIIYTQNRSIEELFSFDDETALTKESFLNIAYHSCKVMIDLNLSLLVFLERHQPTYKKRLEELKKIWDCEEIKFVREQIPDYPKELEFWTQFKITPSFENLQKQFNLDENNEANLRNFLSSVKLAAAMVSSAIWRFEWMRFLEIAPSESITNVELAYKILKSEPPLRRIVRWVKFLKNNNLDERLISYDRFFKLIFTGSPRPLFYASSMLLYYSLIIDKENLPKNLAFYEKHFPLKLKRFFINNEEKLDYYKNITVYMMKKTIAKEEVEDKLIDKII